MENKKTGIQLIAEEREEQIEKHGRTHTHDIIENDNEQLQLAAMMLLAKDYEEGIDPESYPDKWDKDICDKMLRKPRKQRLIIAGALIAAELDRIIYNESDTMMVDEDTWNEITGTKPTEP